MRRHLRRRLWLVPLSVSAVALTAAVGPITSSSAGTITTTACNSRTNNTVDKLVECIRTDDLWNQMKAQQAIADAHPDAGGHASRNSGEPGYKAAVDLAVKLFKASGYHVTVQTYKFPYFAFFGLPGGSEVSPTPTTFTLGTDLNAFNSVGTVTAEVQPVGGIILPPTPTPSSSSGCSPADFAGFTPGNIALIQRGTCNFGEKAKNAVAAGAAGVLIFNEGQPGRTGLAGGGGMIDAAGNSVVPNIPVGFVPFAEGQHLNDAANAGQHPQVKLDFKGAADPNRDDFNVIADSPFGDPNHTVVVDAHYDAIFGAGMLDNASGSVTLMDIAQKMAKVHTKNRLRYILFGGEELGLLGSDFYTHNLSPTELAQIGYDLYADVTATQNYTIGVLDPAAKNLFGGDPPPFPTNVYEPSKFARDEAVKYYNSIGLNHEFFSPVGTDAFWFNMVGVPASGILTGQDCCKTQEQVDLFGGQTGNFEGNLGTTDGGCVDQPFRWCDNLSNNDPNVLTFETKAFAKMVFKMAFDTTILTRTPQQAVAARTAAEQQKAARMAGASHARMS
jgi:hypothetical protein